MIKRLLILLTLIFLTGCAAVPVALEGDYFESQLIPSTVSAEPDTHLGKSVRWGGVIVEVVNSEQETWIEILALPLSEAAKPYGDRTGSLGRFIAKTTDFLDPEVYQKGLKLTVTGTISETIKGKVGQRDYVYATVDTRSHYLWPRINTYRRQYITPGYWFYGFHPYWRFGYPYFGYGVWSYHDHYRPYFPVYGYLSRASTRPHHQYRSGDFAYAAMLDWNRRQQEWALRSSNYQRYPGASNPIYRNTLNGKPVMTNRRSTQSTTTTPNRSSGSGYRSMPRANVNRSHSTHKPTRTPTSQKQK